MAKPETKWVYVAIRPKDGRADLGSPMPAEYLKHYRNQAEVDCGHFFLYRHSDSLIQFFIEEALWLAFGGRVEEA